MAVAVGAVGIEVTVGGISTVVAVATAVGDGDVETVAVGLTVVVPAVPGVAAVGHQDAALRQSERATLVLHPGV